MYLVADFRVEDYDCRRMFKGYRGFLFDHDL